MSRGNLCKMCGGNKSRKRLKKISRKVGGNKSRRRLKKILRKVGGNKSRRRLRKTSRKVGGKSRRNFKKTYRKIGGVALIKPREEDAGPGVARDPDLDIVLNSHTWQQANDAYQYIASYLVESELLDKSRMQNLASAMPQLIHTWGRWSGNEEDDEIFMYMVINFFKNKGLLDRPDYKYYKNNLRVNRPDAAALENLQTKATTDGSLAPEVVAEHEEELYEIKTNFTVLRDMVYALSKYDEAKRILDIIDKDGDDTYADLTKWWRDYIRETLPRLEINYDEELAEKGDEDLIVRDNAAPSPLVSRLFMKALMSAVANYGQPSAISDSRSQLLDAEQIRRLWPQGHASSPEERLAASRRRNSSRIKGYKSLALPAEEEQEGKAGLDWKELLREIREAVAERQDTTTSQKADMTRPPSPA